MTKKIRDTLFGIFVFLFVTITIVLSLYATGYRFNFTWPLRLDLMLVKTGTLALDSKPSGAKITITSETKISSGFPFLKSKKDQVTPIKIKNLLPGEYTVTFNLDNYWPYEKKLKVYPEQTTFLEDIILFKKSLPLNVYLAKAQNISYSPNGNYIWLKNDNLIISAKTEQVAAHLDNKKNHWAGNGKQIINGSKLINLDNGNIFDYQNIIGNVSEVQMSSNNDFLVYLTDNNLAAYNNTTKTTTLIPNSDSIINYELINNIVVIIASEKGQTKIKLFDLNSKSFLNSIELLSSKSFTLNQDNAKTPILIDNEHKIIYLLAISGSDPIIKEIIRGGTIFKWLDNNKLAYTVESEIYIYDSSQSKSYLITRLGERINSLVWSSKNYLIYSTENIIGTINLAAAGNDTTILWQGSDISSLYLDDRNGILYFSGAIGKQSGLYKMALR